MRSESFLKTILRSFRVELVQKGIVQMISKTVFFFFFFKGPFFRSIIIDTTVTQIYNSHSLQFAFLFEINYNRFLY